MSVHYRFKSARDYDTIAFDGLHISVKDLRNSIIQQKKIGKSTDFDLRVTNAQTQEVYEDENALIPKNTSLLIARVPVSTPKQKQWEGYGGNDTPPAKIDEGGPIGKAMDLSSLDAPEDDKIKAMMSQSTQDYDPSNYQKIKGSNQVGPVPPSYRCYKCHQYGHWIKDCPTGKDGGAVEGSALEFKKSTGIPRDFMVPVDGPQVLGAMMLPNGTFAVPVLDMQAYAQKSSHPAPEPTPKPEIPEDLVCSICSDLLADAVMIPCCGNSFCDECIRSTLLESEERECPDCHEKDVSPATLIPNRFLRKSVSTFKNTTGYEKKPINRPKPITEIPTYTETPNETKEQTPPPLADSTENGRQEEAKTIISEADSTEHANADNDVTKEPDFDQHHLKAEAGGTPEQPPGCSPVSDYSPKHQIKSKVTIKEWDDRYGNKEREWEKYHKPYLKSRSPSPAHHRRRRSRSGSPFRRRSSRSPPEGTATPTRDELSAMGNGPPGFMPPGPQPQHPFNTGVPGMPPGHMQGPPMNNMPPGPYPMGQQPTPMAGFPPQGPPPNFGMPPPGPQPPVPYMTPGPYQMPPGVPPGHPPFNPPGPTMGGPPPNFAPPNPNNNRPREFNRGGRNRTPPNVIEDPLAAFNRIIAEKDERRARRARQAAAARKSWSRSPSPRRSYSRSPPPRRRSRSPRRRSRSRSFSMSRSRSRSFSKSPPIRRKASPPPLRRSPPPLREPPPARRGGPPPQSSHYRSPDRGRSPPRRGGRVPEREPRDYREPRDFRDERPRDYRDNKHHAPPPRREARRGDSRERYFDDRIGGVDGSRDTRRDNRGGAAPAQNQWGGSQGIRDGYYQPPQQGATSQQGPQQQGYQGMNRFQPRDFGPPMTNPMPPNMQPSRRYDDIRPPGVEEPPIPGLEPPIIDEFKKKPEKYDSPRERFSPKVDKDREKDKNRDKNREKERDRHARRSKSRTPEFRNPSPKEDSDKHKKHRSRSAESSNRKKDKDHSDEEKKAKSKDKKKKERKEKEKKKKDKKDKHKKDKDKKTKDEFRQVIPKNVTTDDEEEEEKVRKKKKLREEKEKTENEKLSAEAKKKEERKLRFLEDEKRRKTGEETKKHDNEEFKKKIEVKEHKNKDVQEEKDLEEHVNSEMNLYSDILTENEVASGVTADVFDKADDVKPEIKTEFNTEEIVGEQQPIEADINDIKKEIVDAIKEEIVEELSVTNFSNNEDMEEGEVQDEIEINNQSHEFAEEDSSILELHSSDMDKIIDNDNNETLVPLPEKSKWETDEDGLVTNSPLDILDQTDPKKDKITNEVLKRAENAIFAKAINAIKPIEIKKISTERAKLYSDEKPPRIEEKETIVAKVEVKPKAEAPPEKSKVLQDKPRIPVKARLGIKVEDTDKIISLEDKFRDRTLSPFSRKERRIDFKDLRRRDRSRSPRSRRDNSRERRMSRSDRDRGRDRKDSKAKSEDRKKERRKRSRTRSPSSDRKKKKKDKKVKKEKEKKDSKKKEDKDSKNDEKPKAATEKRKPIIDESNFEPDYDLEMHPTDAETDDDKKSKKAKGAKSDSSSDSSSSSSEEERKKKKKKRSKKKRRRSTSSSESDSSSDSSDSEKERKKRKHKKSKKKKKKSKHK